MRKPKFGVVCGLLGIFFILAIIRDGFEKYIPLPPPNRLANLPGAFLRAGVREPVDWQPDYVSGLKRAQKLRRPCLVVMGTCFSKVGRLMDLRVFSNLSVATLVNSSFVPIRVDLGDRPAWASAVFPVSRPSIPFLSEFQIAILDSDGHFLKLLPPPQDLAQIDPTQFIDNLVAFQTLYRSNSTDDDDSADTKRQENDRTILGSKSTRMLPPFDAYASVVYDSTSFSNGLFLESGYVRMLPKAWLYLASTGREQAVRRSMGLFLLSPSVDLVRGGFFDVCESGEKLDVDFDQSTVENAQMAFTLASMGSIQQANIFSGFAHQTFDMLLRDLCPSGLFIPGRTSDLDPQSDRSPVSSFPSPRLAAILNSTEQAWAVEHLNLDRFENSQLIPFLDSGVSVNDPMYAEVMRKLRSSEAHKGRLTGDEYLDVNGNSAASLCECTRVWGDKGRFQELLPAFSELEKFQVLDRVSHTRSAPASEFAGDYFAFADAELQFYLATGSIDHFRRGLDVLQKALDLFYNDSTGQLVSTSDEAKGSLPLSFVNPDLYDDKYESVTAQSIRLCLSYGRMLGPTYDGSRFMKIATDEVAANASIATEGGPEMASYYLASASLVDPECAFTVGPNAIDDANRLFRLRPTRLVSPVSQVVRPDLLGRAPGVYISSGYQVSGPYTVDVAAKILPLLLQVGVSPEQ